ncbi:MAG: hypothetical protein V4462_18295 [Pseudomonadota bacterium]
MAAAKNGEGEDMVMADRGGCRADAALVAHGNIAQWYTMAARPVSDWQQGNILQK